MARVGCRPRTEEGLQRFVGGKHRCFFQKGSTSSIIIRVKVRVRNMNMDRVRVRCILKFRVRVRVRVIFSSVGSGDPKIQESNSG